MPDHIERRIRMTLNQEPCDLAITNARVVDVFNCDIIPHATVRIGDGVILSVDTQANTKANARTVVDANDHYLIPGLFDAHIHIESTMLTPEHFAAAVLPFGTTRVVADPHEIANIAGTEALTYMLYASKNLPLSIHFALPSCVPCTPFEDAGATLAADDLIAFMQNERVISLGEVMNYPGVLACDSQMLAKIAAATAHHLAIDGHCPLARGQELAAYIGCGVCNDHECSTPEGLRLKLAAGIFIFLRIGSAVNALSKLVPAITPFNARRCCLCTDDMHAGDIMQHGHINVILRQAVELGLPAPLAVSMATINPAQAYGLSRVGAIAPGFIADCCLVQDLTNFAVSAVWCSGKHVVQDGKLTIEIPRQPVPEKLCSSIHLAPFSDDMFTIPVHRKRVRIIVLKPHTLVTEEAIRPVAATENGLFSAAANPGLCTLAVLDRHNASGRIGLGILQGYAKPGTVLGGALATSIAHDSHNIVVAGSSEEDMKTAVQEVCAMQGGIAVVQNGCVLARLALPVGGIMSTEDAKRVAQGNEEINAAARRLNVCDDVDPVITLAFMSLCVIPAIKLNTRGLFDVNSWKFVDLCVD
ncbi:MAG: adenine deaminase [Desulfovibrionaceae bacterium]|nr:adenine deaminase [Desulfovibrionaceae bacterium]